MRIGNNSQGIWQLFSNKGFTIPYEPGTISIMQAGVPHEVDAGSEGLYLFAKFMPALC